jgi:hypothetical protein
LGEVVFYATAKVEIIGSQKNLWQNFWPDFSHRPQMKKPIGQTGFLVAQFWFLVGVLAQKLNAH